MIPVGIPRRADGIASKSFFFGFSEGRREVNEHVVSSGVADEGVIDDDKVVARGVLLDGRFAKFAQGAAIPGDFDFRVLRLVFGGAGDERSVAARVVPSKAAEFDAQAGLVKQQGMGFAECVFLSIEYSGRWLSLGEQNVLAIHDDFAALI